MGNSAAVVKTIKAARPNVQSTGFRQALRRFVGPAAFGFLPDAFEVHEDLKIITLIEVVETNPITISKAKEIYRLGSMLERQKWGLSVAVYDHCAGFLGEAPAALFHPMMIAAAMDAKPHSNVFPAVMWLQRRWEAETGRAA